MGNYLQHQREKSQSTSLTTIQHHAHSALQGRLRAGRRLRGRPSQFQAELTLPQTYQILVQLRRNVALPLAGEKCLQRGSVADSCAQTRTTSMKNRSNISQIQLR